jgi:hypothetical protein
MRLRILAAALAPVLSASIAHAQAPGEVYAQPAAQTVVIVPAAPQMAAPPMAPPVAACAAPIAERESVMSNRWSLGFSAGSMALAPEGSPDDKTTFAVGELDLRFRLTPHLELEASIGGGRERTADNQRGDLEVTTVALAARYRFMPEQPWNWFVMAGFGGAAVTRHDATDQERNDATQPLGMLGIGLERRFHHFALQAEARAVGLGKSTKDTMSTEPAAMSTITPTPTTDPLQRSGGLITIGASYYF